MNKNIIHELNSLINNLQEIKNEITSKKKYFSQKPNFSNELNLEDRLIIEAILQGYISNKEILNYFRSSNLNLEFSFKYRLPILFSKFNCVSRGELLRKLIQKYC